MASAELDPPPARAGPYPPRDGNLVRPLVDGVPAFRRILAAVAGAHRRVWATIAFVDRTAELPDGHGTLFDVLDRAAARGVDVRVVFWREPGLDPARPGWEHFPGNAEERAWLAGRGARFRARWDHLPRGCHHQKSWIVDAGEPGAIAFVGGINLDRMSIVDRGHRGGREEYHDLYLEIRGPATTDVQGNFVQRWNEASERTRADGTWPPGADDDLADAVVEAQPVGSTTVQIVRTRRDGERGVREAYLAAIVSARRAIYLENQFFASTEVFAALAAALARGVEVVALVPRAPLEEVRRARADPRGAPAFAALAALGRHDRFTLAGLVVPDGAGGHRDVYVHAKMALVDDRWGTVGSANLEHRSLHRDTELNAAFWDEAVVRALRADLFAEHLDEPAADDDAADALARFRDVARANADRMRRGEPLRGLALALDPARYAADPRARPSATS